MDERAYTYIDQRLQRVEAEVAFLRSALQRAAAPQTPGATAAPLVAEPAAAAAAPAPAFAPGPGFAIGPPPTAPSAPAVAPRQGLSLEAFVAGRGLQIAGLVLLLVGVAFFLKLAFDEGIIGPSARVLLGLATSAALIVAGARVPSERYAFFADGTIALGGGIGFLAVWAAGSLFSLVPHGVALGALVGITAIVAALSYARRSERLALAAAFGGYLAPVLLVVDAFDPTPLFGYLFTLSAGMLLLSRAARFRYLDAAAFLGILVYAPTFHIEASAAGASLVQKLGYFAGFFVEFVAALHFAADQDRALSGTRLAVLASCVGAFIIALEVELADHRHVLAAALFMLAAALLASVRLPRVPPLLREVYGWLGLGTVTLAIPALTNSLGVGQVWAIESAIVMTIGIRSRLPRVTAVGLAIYVVAALATLVAIDDVAIAAPPFLNARFLSFALLAGAAAFTEAMFRRSDVAEESTFVPILQVATHAFALVGLTTDAYRFVVRTWNDGSDSSALERAQFAISILWTFYGAALFATGLARGVALLRWLGLGLFVITIAKVFLVDLASVGALLRIGSFIVLGLVLTGASALYQRSAIREGDEK